MDWYVILGKSSSILLSYLLNIIGALVILILGKIFANWFTRLVNRGMERVPGLDTTLKPLILNIIRYSIYVFVVAAVLAQFGVQTASIITVLGAAGLAIGLLSQMPKKEILEESCRTGAAVAGNKGAHMKLPDTVKAQFSI